jgi:ATP phosphoribosyltransferase regulatory subunit
MRAFELFGFERVSVPAFEYADVLERGLGALGADEVLRFVEPETGEVVALRPDMTPQVARLLATRLGTAPSPCRLCYEGSVLRRRRERARRHRQIPQAGVELIGSAAPDGDVEVLTLASEAVRAVGLSEFVIDLGHARIAGSLIETAPAEARAQLVEALALKDGSELELRAKACGLPAPLRRALVDLVDPTAAPRSGRAPRRGSRARRPSPPSASFAPSGRKSPRAASPERRSRPRRDAQLAYYTA